jgi:hypothetical protein
VPEWTKIDLRLLANSRQGFCSPISKHFHSRLSELQVRELRSCTLL